MLLSCAAAFAQTSIKVNVPDVVAADEQFNVIFVIEGENAPSSFEWEPSDAFQVVWGPQKGSSTSISIVNGKRSKTSQTTFTYVLLPKHTGNAVIPEATATVAGKEITSQKKSINIVSGGSSSSQGQSSSSQTAVTGDIPQGDLFLQLSLSRSNVVVGEPVTATLKLYQRVNIAGFEDARFPTFNGFWNQEIEAPTNIEFHRESLNDMIYNAAVLRSWTLIPQQAGDLVIEPAELVCLVNVRVAPTGPQSIFDSFFQDDYRTIRKRVTSKSYTVHVSKLPAGAPASFGGGVGKFSIKASVSRDSLKAHDAASLIVSVTGTGNVSLLNAPKVNFPPDFEVYDTKVKDSSNGKSFEFPFIPRSHGDFTIPPVEYSYYDVASGKYVTLATDPIDIKVSRGNGSESVSEGGTLVQPSVQKDVRSLGSDIRYISSDSSALQDKGSFFVGSPLFIILLILLAAAAVAFWFIYRAVSSRKSDVVMTKNRQATKMARKRLSLAGNYLDNNLYTAFYEELHRALLGFVADKLNMDTTDMTKENIEASLVRGGAGESLASSFTGLLDACEFARYAPDSGHEAMNSHYENALEVITALDSTMKMKKSPSAPASVIVAAILFAMAVPSQQTASAKDDGLWDSAVQAYADGRWQDALDAWMQISDSGLESPELYCNIGNACFKSDDIAHAILYYERALKIDPSFADARFNLEYASGFVQDRIDQVPEFFLKEWTGSLCRLLSSDAWAVIFLILFTCALAGALLFLLSRRTALRKTGFYAGCAALLLSLGALGFARWQKTDYFKADKAIVTAPVISVKSSPGNDSNKDLFILHEGTKVRIIDKVGEWRNVELSDGRQGWLPSTGIEVI